MSIYKKRVRPQTTSTGTPLSSSITNEDNTNTTPRPTQIEDGSPLSTQPQPQMSLGSGLNIRLRTNAGDGWNPFSRQETVPLATPATASTQGVTYSLAPTPAQASPGTPAGTPVNPTSNSNPSKSSQNVDTVDLTSASDAPSESQTVAQTPTQPQAEPQDPAAVRARTPGPLVLFHRCQSRNPVLTAITQVMRAEGRITCDYECSPRVGVVYVSARFHVQKPEYAPMRMGLMARTQYMLKVLLVQLDVELAKEPLMALTLSALTHNHTVICASSTQEVNGRTNGDTFMPSIKKQMTYQPICQISTGCSLSGVTSNT